MDDAFGKSFAECLRVEIPGNHHKQRHMERVYMAIYRFVLVVGGEQMLYHMTPKH